MRIIDYCGYCRKNHRTTEDCLLPYRLGEKAWSEYDAGPTYRPELVGVKHSERREDGLFPGERE